MKNFCKGAFVLIGVLIALSALSGCSKASRWYVSEGVVWNTTYRIVYESAGPMDDSIQAVFSRVERSLSAFSETSLVSRINRGETDSVDSDLLKVFAVSKEVNRLSGGLFDPTVAPLVNLWGFGNDKLRREEAERDSGEFVVMESEIAEALRRVGIDSCDVSDGRMKRKSPGTTFNFSAVAKGYGCDLISEMLMRNGSGNHMVEIGGEIAVAGHNKSGNPWRIQIDAPIEGSAPMHENLLTVELENSAGIATSGNYRNFHKSLRYGKFGHTINPKTGYPVQSDVVSATVIASNAALADAWATACMAMPADSALCAVEKFGDIACMLVISVNDSTLALRRTANFPVR